MAIFGGIVKILLWPIEQIVFRGMYSVFIRGPLWFLNTENRALNYATGSYTDKLLFDTSIVDGHPQLNFFSGSSPLKPFFFTMIGVTGALLVLFIGFTIIGSLVKEGKSSPVKKLSRLTISSASIFAIPTIFLIVLSITGGFIGSLSGKSVALSSSGIGVYQKYTQDRINALRNISTSSDPFNKTAQLGQGYILKSEADKVTSSWLDINATKSVSDIYNDLSTKYDGTPTGNAYKPSDDIINQAKLNQGIYQSTLDLVAKYSGGVSGSVSLAPELNNALNNVSDIINKLQPKQKSEASASNLQDAINELDNIRQGLSNFKTSADQLISYLPDPEHPEKITTSEQAAIYNFKTAFGLIWGAIPEDQLDDKNVSIISNLQTLNYNIGNLIDGKPFVDDKGLLQFQPNGLYSLKQSLSSFEDSSLVVTFYQVVTGNHDTNWDKTFSSLQNGGFMLLIGFFLIIGAIAILGLVIIEAFIRSCVLAGLFIIAPVMVGTSVLDDGARMKTWIAAVIAQLISIFGVVIILRLSGVLTSKFTALLDSSGEFGGESGYLTRSILVGLFAYSTLIAAYRSKALFASLAGYDQGIISAMQGFPMLGKIVSGGMVAGKLLGKASGLGAGGNLSARAASGAAGGASRLSNFKQTWSKRNPITKLDNAMASVSRGKYGSALARGSTMGKRLANVQAKESKFANRKKLIESMQSGKKQTQLSEARNKLQTTRKALKGMKARKDQN